MTERSPARYHPALVALHWLLALFLIGALVAGKLVLEPLANTDPDKLLSFRMHMGLGLVILVLMLVRLAVRLRTRHPAPADAGSALLNGVSVAVHWGLYAAAIAMAASGVALSVSSGLGNAVFGDGAMPADFAGNPARAVHGVLSGLLLALIVVHVAAAVWHQKVRRDGLMARMWFGPR
jgi:cytochrome b561